ncbi:hypothetical protein JCM3770_000872 [Rhodotorula araucariae]
MSRRLRVPLQPWLARALTTASRPALPSPLQRELFRRVAQPVAVITARIPSSSPAAGAPAPGRQGELDGTELHNHGATLSSLSSISLSPPLVAFSLRLPSRLAAFLSPPLGSAKPAPAPFRVHLLSTAQEPLARAFARQAPLPARAQPSPPPPPPSPGSAAEPDPPATSFAPELFEALERGALGALDCRVVHTVPLSTLGLGGEAGAGAAVSAGEDQPRSELFIARVERVQLGSAADVEGEGSLLYWDQRYAGVRALEAEEADVDVQGQ